MMTIKTNVAPVNGRDPSPELAAMTAAAIGHAPLNAPKTKPTDADLDIPAALKIAPEQRAQAWKESPPVRAKGGAPATPKREEEPATKALRKELADKEKATAKAKKKADKEKRAAARKLAGKPSAKKTAPKGAPTAKPKTPAKAAKEVGVRAGSKLELIVGLLKRPEGCTAAEIMSACHWPAVSVPQQARAAGLKLRKEKEGRVTRYRAA